MAAADAESELAYSCSTCNKSYKRREHLQRHVASHSAIRPYRCARCSCTYQRADVLKRHAQSCQTRADGAVLAAASGRRRACDRCVQQKKACSAEHPCHNCRRKSVTCRYSFGESTAPGRAVEAAKERHDGSVGAEAASAASSETLVLPAMPAWTALPALAGSNPVMSAVALGDGGHHPPFQDLGSYASPSDFLECSTTNNTNWLDFLNLTADCLPSSESSSSSRDLHHDAQPSSFSFRFLDHFTSRTGLVASFDCGSLVDRKQVLSTFLLEEAASRGLPPSPSSGIAIGSVSAAAAAASVVLADSDGGPSLFLPPSVPQDPLIIKTHQILLRIKEVITVKPRNSAVTLDWSAGLEQRCLDFFSPFNIRKFLALYWAVWHPNVNLVHRPSFDPGASKSILIAAMVLLGASISPEDADNEQAKPWFNCVEEMVFLDDDFCSDPLYTCDTTVLNPKTNWRKIQALQAAYIVCLYQNWEGTDASKRRIRRYRFSTLVSAARDIGIVPARHLDYGSAPLYEFDWKEFVMREQLIRMFLWIFLLDHAFVIFNNLPPRLVIKEMGMHMAFPESAFQAATADECALEVHNWLRRPSLVRTITLREAVEVLCRDTVRSDVARSFADLGPLNLFAIVSAFHSLIFHQQNSSGGTGHLQPIYNALGNWKSIWEIYSSELSFSPPHTTASKNELTPDTMWKRVGFSRHSPEYWLLATLLVDRLSPADPLPSSDAASPSGGRSTLDPILSKYDQTSMQQVNELIVEFQNVQIGYQ